MKPEIKSTTNPNVFFANIVADQVESSSSTLGEFVREFNRIQRSCSHPSRDLATLINYRKSTIDQEDFGSTVNYWRLPWIKSVRGDYPVQKLVTAVDWILRGDCPCSEAGDCPGIKLVRGDCPVQSQHPETALSKSTLVGGET